MSIHEIQQLPNLGQTVFALSGYIDPHYSGYNGTLLCVHIYLCLYVLLQDSYIIHT